MLDIQFIFIRLFFFFYLKNRLACFNSFLFWKISSSHLFWFFALQNVHYKCSQFIYLIKSTHANLIVFLFWKIGSSAHWIHFFFLKNRLTPFFFVFFSFQNVLTLTPYFIYFIKINSPHVLSKKISSPAHFLYKINSHQVIWFSFSKKIGSPAHWINFFFEKSAHLIFFVFFFLKCIHPHPSIYLFYKINSHVLFKKKSAHLLNEFIFFFGKSAHPTLFVFFSFCKMDPPWLNLFILKINSPLLD